MPTFLLIRHGIAEDPRPGLADRDRALTDRGRAHARAAMAALVARGLRPDRGCCSPYRRAVETLACLQEAAGPLPVQVAPALVPHHPPAAAAAWLLALAAEAEPEAVVACVGHEPLLGDLVAGLTGRTVDMSRAACAVLRWDGRWSLDGHHPGEERP